MPIHLRMRMVMDTEALVPFLKELSALTKQYQVGVAEAQTDYGEGLLWYFKHASKEDEE